MSFRKQALQLADPAGGDLPPKNIACIVADEQRMPAGADVLDAVPNSREVFRALKVFRDRVNDHLKNNLPDWPHTRLYVYFSGHGIAPVAREAALLMADASTKAAAPMFLIKLGLVATGVAVMAAQKRETFAPAAATTRGARSLAFVSLAVWFTAIFAGRLMAYPGLFFGI